MAILSCLLACSASTYLFDMHRSKCCYHKPRIFNLPRQSNLSVCAAAPDLGWRGLSTLAPRAYLSCSIAVGTTGLWPRGPTSPAASLLALQVIGPEGLPLLQHRCWHYRPLAPRAYLSCSIAVGTTGLWPRGPTSPEASLLALQVFLLAPNFQTNTVTIY